MRDRDAVAISDLTKGRLSPFALSLLSTLRIFLFPAKKMCRLYRSRKCVFADMAQGVGKMMNQTKRAYSLLRGAIRGLSAAHGRART